MVLRSNELVSQEYEVCGWKVGSKSQFPIFGCISVKN